MIILRRHGVLPLPVLLLRLHARYALHTSPRAARTNATDPAPTPKPPLELDEALQTLLQDADVSLRRARGRRAEPSRGRMRRELEVVDADADVDMAVPLSGSAAEEEAEEARLFPRKERKSPAASFGSRCIGAVVLPFELERSILRLISESEKPLVHADARRLFQEENAAEDAWSTRYAPPDYTVPSAGSRMAHIKARLARHRDGTAFASVVMPAQYAVVTAVLTNIVARLGPEWARGIKRVVEWGGGTGAGMWAALHAFGRPSDAKATIAMSRIASYVGIEKREGLTTIARRLLRDVPLGGTTVSLQKALLPSDCVPRLEGFGTVALSTFCLSTLGSSGLRRQMIREMWESGADVIVVIDDASAQGFRYVVEARELLLKFGQREVDAVEASGVDPAEDVREKRGAHVIAPCPHDFACPLALATGPRVRCTFEQRLQRPAFVRRTKHAGAGEEDVGYAYVVVRRGPRPRATHAVGGVETVAEVMREGRKGAVGRWAEEAARAKELGREEQMAQQARWAGVTDDEAVEAADEVTEAGEAEASSVEEARADMVAGSTDAEPANIDDDTTSVEDAVAETVLVDQALEDALRLEAYSWPRINFSPLKRSGHILIDACMPTGHEMRLTFPRSQGKQVYYDARKSAWGDLFPHTSKHRPVPRYAGPTKNGDSIPREKGRGRGRGEEGEPVKVGLQAAGRAHGRSVSNSVKEEDRRRRRERQRGRITKEMHGEPDEE